MKLFRKEITSLSRVCFKVLIRQRRRSAAARLLRLWIRIPPGAWMFVCCECCVLPGRGLCDELITRPEESYRLWCVVVCDLETSRIGTPYIYDISSLRVKTDQTLKMCTTTQNKVFKIVTDELLIMPKRILEQNPITARPKIYSLNKFKYNFPISCLSHKLLLSKQFLHQNNVRISCLPIQATCTVQHKHLDSITLTILQYMS